MTEFKDWDMLRNSTPKPAKPRFIECTKCKSQWFEQIEALKVNADIDVSLGQKTLYLNNMPQIVLRCLRCNDFQELPVNLSGVAKPLQEIYFDLRSTLESPTSEDKQ